MGCNVSKDVKVDDQGGQGAPLPNGIDGIQLTEDEAAKKIQAQYRGFKTRQSLKKNGPEGDNEEDEEEAENEEAAEVNPDSDAEETQEEQNNPEEEVDIDLNEPGLEEAAVKIQASFRGFKVRKEMEAEGAAEEQE